ncbi:hypothetical protein AwDysgo_14030 [Bacteroidales bacterium]|nr:hypothetical protein AwDysgo_14030 [Bacteroidales bacterium]
MKSKSCYSAALFEYEPSFLSKGLDIDPITMPINSVRSQEQMPWMGYKERLYQGLPPMIADSLPDKWGNSLFYCVAASVAKFDAQAKTHTS